MTEGINTSEPDALAEQLYYETPLSRGEAEALAHSEYFALPRQVTAEELDISPSALDDRLRNARQKLNASERLLEIDDALTQDYREPAYECSDCGAKLGGVYTRDPETGEPLCFDCAGLDRDEVLP